MSTVAFLNFGMHGYINPTLPVVAELVRRGHTATYHTSPAFAVQIEAAGAKVHLYSAGDLPLPDPPIPLAMLEELARPLWGWCPGCSRTSMHGAACPWVAVAARELGVPAAATFTTFAFNRQVPSPTGISRELVAAAAARPRLGWGFVRARWALHRGYDTRALPLTDLMNAREPLNLVFTSSAQPGADAFDSLYRFVGASVGSRLTDPGFDAVRLEDLVQTTALPLDPHSLASKEGPGLGEAAAQH